MRLERILLVARHERSVPFDTLFREYESALGASGRWPATWQLYTPENEAPRKGLGGVREAAAHYRPDEFVLTLEYPDGYSAHLSRRQEHWSVIIEQDLSRPITRASVLNQVALVREAAKIPSLTMAEVTRNESRSTYFPLRPPIAAANYAVITTPAAVDAAYLQPEVFWKVWDDVEEHGDYRLCTRALDLPDPNDENAWLARTFYDSMALARAARPKLTWYGLAKRPGPEYAPFWEPGEVVDGKAGLACLRPAGYDPVTRTYELTAYIPKSPSPEFDNHLLLYDIHVVRAAVIRQKTLAGEPIDTVRVVFLDEPTARAERRPLLDVGARVYFLGPNTELIEVTD